MAVSEDILAARRYGVVHCGVLSLSAPTVAALAKEFGLLPEAACYRESDEASARLSVQRPIARKSCPNSRRSNSPRGSSPSSAQGQGS
jgi:hypothetical protein